MHPMTARIKKLEAKSAPCGPIVTFILPPGNYAGSEFEPDRPSPNAMARFVTASA